MNRCSQCQYVWPIIIYSWRSIIHLSAARSVVYHFCDFLKPFRNSVEASSDKKLVNDEGFCLVSVPCLFTSLCLSLNQLTDNKQIFIALQIKIQNWSTWASAWPQTAGAFTSGVMKQSQLISARSAQLYLLVLELPLLPHQPIRVSLWWTLAGGVRWWRPLQSVFLLLFLQPHSLALWGPAEVLLSQ